MLKKYPKTFRTLLNIFIVMFFSGILWFNPTVLVRTISFFENGAFGLQLRYNHKPVTADTPITIVAIDDKSIQEQGQWPWARKKIGSVLTKLFDLGASVIAVDVMFSEKEDNPLEEVLQELGPTFPQRAQLEEKREMFDGDLDFAKALEKGKSVLSFVLTRGGKDIGLLPPALQGISKKTFQQLHIPEMENYIGNITVLQRAAKHGGLINSTPDRDGVVRYAPLMLGYKGNLYPSLSLESVRLFLNENSIDFNLAAYGKEEVLEGVFLGPQLIPTDPYGRVLIPFHGGPYSFQYVSASEVLSDSVLREKIENKIIFIGLSATAFGDLIPTPVSSIFPAVEVHANLAASMIDGFFPIRPLWGKGFELVHIIVVGLLCAFLLPRMGPIRATLFAVALTALLLAINRWICLKYQLYLPIIFPLFVLYVQFFASLVTGLLVAHKSHHRS
ncbi:MAG: hypothetical protein COT85_01555 [Chlamydiae bacterium CG10_big_fil_rev_8_21_14_0_10_42_34]|nr:MAG: hypothetical protein COT85_01555 [Chlamydiae bacterium CG10_big_fil_rev_8_21_14_0_10_42_34]